MSRFAIAAANSAAQLSQIAYRQMVEMGVTSSTIYLTTGQQFIYALGNTYTPVGLLGGMDPIQEESDPFPRSIRFYLAAINSATLFDPLQEDMFGRSIVVRHGYLDPQLMTLVSTPEVLWRGNVNKVEIRFGDSEKGNYYEVEGISSLYKQAQASNFNLETHWITLGYSGDLFFSLIDQVPLTKAMWGQQPTYYIPGGRQVGAPEPTPTIPDFSGFPF